jgi:hypothetical protein
MFTVLGGLQAPLLTSEYLIRDDPLTYKATNQLQEINRLGFVTTGSQVGCLVQDELVGDPNYPDGTPFVHKQRAFLDGFTNVETVVHLQKLMQTSDLLVVSHKTFAHEPCTTCLIPVSTWNYPDKIHTNTSACDWYEFEDHWRNLPIFTSLFDTSWQRFPELPELQEKGLTYDECKKQAVCVAIMDPHWCRETYLFDTVLAALQAQKK